MPMITRAQTGIHKSDSEFLENVCPVPGDIAASQNSASTSGAIAPALCSSPHLEAHNPAPHPELPYQSAAALSKSASLTTIRSSSTIKVQKIAAKVEHARRLAKIQDEQDKAAADRQQAAADRQQAAADRDRALADLELQAELAAIASSCSRSSRVESWLVDCHNSSTGSNNVNPAYLFARETKNEEDRGDASQFPTDIASAKQEARAALFSPAQGHLPCEGFATTQPATFSCRSASSGYANELCTTLHTRGLGTHNRNTKCNWNTNKNQNQSVDTQDNFILLANAIADLGKKKTRVSEIPSFDGRALEWLPFKRAFQQSRESFTPSDNIARITAALHGPAREAVATLLVSAEDPEVIIRALESRFAQPEYIILQQLALVRGLPRLSTYEVPRELNIFACRVRNCVEVIRLLNQPEYFASPELANTIIGKLTPLLRSRWADFAAARVNSGKFRLENIADFLENEANLQIKFGFVMSESTPVNKSQSLSIKTTKDKIYTIATTSNPATRQRSFYLCLYCHDGKHEVFNCESFQSLSVDDRWQWVIDNKLCRKCLRKGSHQYKNCKKRCEVEGCLAERRHHTLLHKAQLVTEAHVVQSTPSSTSSEIAVQSVSGIPCIISKDKLKSAIVAHSSVPSNLSTLKALLKVIAVTVTGPQGSVDTYALLDDGSSVTLLDQSVADSIGAKGPQCRLNIDCIGGLSTQTDVSFIDIYVKGRYSMDTCKIRARSIPNLGIKSQSARLDDIAEHQYLSDLVDVLCYDDAKPMLLIGADNWQVTLPRAVRLGSRNQPAAAHTALGWVLFGTISHRLNSTEPVNHISAIDDNDVSLDSLLKDYFKLDSIGIVKVEHRGASEQRALNILDDTTKRLDTGRYETGLLWRDNITAVPRSRELALSRFTSLERKMSRNKAYAEAYKLNIQGMIGKGYAELCLGPPSGQIPWYLPHFGVVHPHKKKLRVVHDAAAKCAGVSLNSLLLTGPDLLQPLLSIVLRFREGAVALSGDIREMFPQVKIRPEDRDSQRFLWRDSSDLPVQEFRMSSMIFGAACSPCSALYVKNKNASYFQAQYPDAVRSIIEDHYMDDFLGSFDSTSEAAQRASEILSIHKAGCFEMCSWVSNRKEALALIPPDLHATDTTEVSLGPISPSQVRVLGLTWNVSEDRLHFIKSLPKPLTKFTKRSVLSLLMSVYDPLGFLIPVIMKGRVLFQKTWKLGIDWDQVLPCHLIEGWKGWFLEIQNVCNSSIPRCYISSTGRVKNVQMHVFADASERVYACVAYWRFTCDDDSVSLSLIGGKGRLAPLKPVSIPRLELQAALIASRFSTYVSNAHKRKPNQTFFWTDSLTVLKWLRSDACAFKAFVSFRVGEIAETTTICNWRYVPTALNVADDATRDCRFSTSSRWFTGPSFLLSPESDWPCEPACNVPPVTEELKCDSESVGLLVAEPLKLPLPVVADHQRFSSWLRLLRATARTLQSVTIFRSYLFPYLIVPDSIRDDRNLLLLSVKDLNVAEIQLFNKVQLDSFYDELLCVNAARPLSNVSRLKNIALVLGKEGLLRLAGRTAAAEDLEFQPIVLDGKHRITRLLIHSWHVRFGHGNNELVVNELHQRFYILSLRPAVRATSQKCQFCRNRKAKPVSPPEGDLPKARLAHHQRPFTHVGLDYFGPVNITICRRKAKRWVALFTCMTVRAIHLEIVENLTTDSALMSLRRFIARRGCPVRIYSDNGTSFVGAAKMLPELYEFCANRKIEWRFIPPSAPFMGGCWERLVRSVKNTLAVTLKELSPREEVLSTLLLEAESIINSRPLTHVSVDADSEHVITPFTFLIGSSSNELPLGTFTDADLYRRVDWRKAQRLADQFWKRFVKEYLPTLVPRKSTPQVRELKIGDLVFIADGTLARNCWPHGRVVAVHPGKDGIVRVVDIVTKGGVLRRPTRKVALLVAGQ